VSAQAENLERLSTKIAPAILDFYRAKYDAAVPVRFHMEELQRYIRERFPTAPDSPSRVMRDLRQRKLLDYKVISRRASLYEIIAVARAVGS
jgi:hypothetical protein